MAKRCTSASRCCSPNCRIRRLPAAVDEGQQATRGRPHDDGGAQGARFLGVLGVMDTPRPVAAQVMAELRQLGIERLIMISGDNQQVADAVAKTVG
jgi:Cd2+/Zn2+-exporting ATPase